MLLHAQAHRDPACLFAPSNVSWLKRAAGTDCSTSRIGRTLPRTPALLQLPLLAKDAHSFEREGGEEKEGERGEGGPCQGQCPLFCKLRMSGRKGGREGKREMERGEGREGGREGASEREGKRSERGRGREGEEREGGREGGRGEEGQRGTEGERRREGVQPMGAHPRSMC